VCSKVVGAASSSKAARGNAGTIRVVRAALEEEAEAEAHEAERIKRREEVATSEDSDRTPSAGRQSMV